MHTSLHRWLRRIDSLQITTTRNTWGHTHTDHGLNPQAAVECFNSLKGLILILQSHARIHEFGLDLNECRDRVDKFQQELLTHSVNSEIQIDVFELAVLFNMRACRHFVESMFFKHQLRAVIGMVEEKKLFDFSSMLTWLSEQDSKSHQFSQEDKKTRRLYYQLARQGRNMVFHGSKNGPQQLLLLMSATLEISNCLMLQLKGEVIELLDPAECCSFPEPGEHEEEFKKDIKQRAAEIDGMIRLLLCRVNIQSFATLLHGASEQQWSSRLSLSIFLNNLICFFLTCCTVYGNANFSIMIQLKFEELCSVKCRIKFLVATFLNLALLWYLKICSLQIFKILMKMYSNGQSIWIHVLLCL